MPTVRQMNGNYKAFILLIFLSIWRLKEMIVLFYLELQNFRKIIALSKVPRLRPFVLVVRETCKWRRVYSTGRMTLTGKIGLHRENPISVPLFPPQISYRLAWDRIQASAVRGRWLTTWAMARLWKPKLICTGHKVSGRTSKKTFSFHYKDQSVQENKECVAKIVRTA
jgi:hypothetical protein